MIFTWGKARKEKNQKKNPSDSQPLLGGIQFNDVSLPPSLYRISIQIPLGSWVMIYGSDELAKALFCDLCFGYLLPVKGSIISDFNQHDVNFLGRSSTTYGLTFLDHLNSGVKEKTRRQIEFVVKNILNDRLKRHLRNDLLAFKNNQRSHEVALDERDLMEIAEANSYLQSRSAVIIDTTSDFYRKAFSQGFRHSPTFLRLRKTTFWLVHQLPTTGEVWNHPEYRNIEKISLSFDVLRSSLATPSWPLEYQ